MAKLTRPFAEHHPVLRLVLKRDGWWCWFCGSDFGAGDDLPSLEHLTPLCRGGARWEVENLAFAHKRCNQILDDLPREVKETLRQKRRELGRELTYGELYAMGVRHGAAGYRRRLRKERRRAVRRWSFDQRRRLLEHLYSPLVTMGEIAGSAATLRRL